MATAKHVPPGRKRQGAGGTRTQKPAPPPKAHRGPTTSGTATGTTAASSSVTGLRVRMFRVGFGDFFLLSVPTSGGAKHILIDCGVHAKDLKSIGAAVTEMAKACGSELALLVMTHRHADHISGFYTCRDVFKQISVERVWMSWFEDPGNKTAVAFQAGLNALAGQLSNRLAARSDGGSEELAAMAENITGGMAADGRSANQGALDVLHNGFKNKPVYGYFQAGDKPTLPQDLVDAGLSAQILGPPIDASLVAQMTNTSQQYLAADGQSDDEHVVPFRQPFWVDSSAYPPKTFEIYDADEIKDMVDSVQPDILAAQAMAADKTLNNQSLVILFTFQGKNLLFAGDAQWGNWENFLYGGAYGTPGHTEVTTRAKTILGQLDFYKVGHHGSANATPKDAVAAMRHGCVGMCSTQLGAYNEVPRAPLLQALSAKMDGQLARSDQISASASQPPDPKAGALPSKFKDPTGMLYIDYEF